MCRLMGYVAAEETTFSRITGPAFAEFAELSAIHNDGWGIAAIDTHRDRSTIVEPTAAKNSPSFTSSAENLQSDGALLHFRWATKGLEVKEENTHPFTFGEFSFIHNGGVMPPESLDPFIDTELLANLRGTTDSERYFYLLITQINKLGLVEGVLEGVRLIREKCVFSSLNAMILTPKQYLVISEHDNTKIPSQFEGDYYELFYRRDEHGILVASSGWDQSSWTALPNHRLLVINRETMDLEIQEI